MVYKKDIETAPPGTPSPPPMKEPTTNSVFGGVAIDAEVTNGADSDIDAGIELIVDWATEKFGRQQLISAKEEFFWRTGKVFYDDEFFARRMDYFIDFFLFQRLLEGKHPDHSGYTPFEAWRRLYGEERDAIVTGARHSVYRIQRINQKALAVQDLLEKERIQILPRRGESFSGVAKKDLFQGFIYETGAGWYLSRGIFFHPTEAWRPIRRQIKWEKLRQGGDRIRLLSHLAKLQVQQMRHRHLDCKSIYSRRP